MDIDYKKYIEKDEFDTGERLILIMVILWACHRKGIKLFNSTWYCCRKWNENCELHFL